jgi:hypothetical protein
MFGKPRFLSLIQASTRTGTWLTSEVALSYSLPT